MTVAFTRCCGVLGISAILLLSATALYSAYLSLAVIPVMLLVIWTAPKVLSKLPPGKVTNNNLPKHGTKIGLQQLVSVYCPVQTEAMEQVPEGTNRPRHNKVLHQLRNSAFVGLIDNATTILAEHYKRKFTSKFSREKKDALYNMAQDLLRVMTTAFGKDETDCKEASSSFSFCMHMKETRSEHGRIVLDSYLESSVILLEAKAKEYVRDTIVAVMSNVSADRCGTIPLHFLWNKGDGEGLLLLYLLHFSGDTQKVSPGLGRIEALACAYSTIRFKLLEDFSADEGFRTLKSQNISLEYLSDEL